MSIRNMLICPNSTPRRLNLDSHQCVNSTVSIEPRSDPYGARVKYTAKKLYYASYWVATYPRRPSKTGNATERSFICTDFYIPVLCYHNFLSGLSLAECVLSPRCVTVGIGFRSRSVDPTFIDSSASYFVLRSQVPPCRMICRFTSGSVLTHSSYVGVGVPPSRTGA